MASKKQKKRATREHSPSPQPRKKRKLSRGDTHDDEPAVTIKSQSKKKVDSDEVTPRQLEDLVEALRARYGAESFAQRAYRLPGRMKCCWEYLERGECRDPTCTFTHTNEPKTSEMEMPFGKYSKDPLGPQKLHKLPVQYVEWMREKNVLSGKSPSFVAEMKRVWPDIFD